MLPEDLSVLLISVNFILTPWIHLMTQTHHALVLPKVTD